MSTVGQSERVTQNRVAALFCNELGYRHLGDWTDRNDNSNVEEKLLSDWLTKSGYTTAQISAALYKLRTEADIHAVQSIICGLRTTWSARRSLPVFWRVPTSKPLEVRAPAVRIAPRRNGSAASALKRNSNLTPTTEFTRQSAATCRSSSYQRAIQSSSCITPTSIACGLLGIGGGMPIALKLCGGTSYSTAISLVPTGLRGMLEFAMRGHRLRSAIGMTTTMIRSRPVNRREPTVCSARN